MDDLAPWVTVSVFVGMIIVGLLPKIPVWAKILIQVAVGVGIYVGMPLAMFNLPNGDNLKVPMLFGGNDGSSPSFNFLSMGFLSTAVGIIFSLIGFGVGKLLGRRSGGGDE